MITLLLSLSMLSSQQLIVSNAINIETASNTSEVSSRNEETSTSSEVSSTNEETSTSNDQTSNESTSALDIKSMKSVIEKSANQDESNLSSDTGVLSEFSDIVQDFLANAFGIGVQSMRESTIEHQGIKGSMTEKEYRENATITASNDTANETWNEKYSFNPNVNVVHVSNYLEFKSAYRDNTVSKIVLDANIKPPTSQNSELNLSIIRQNSIEIDGQGHRLDLWCEVEGAISGSLNVGKPNITNGTEPVFHLHDITCRNRRTVGLFENSAWSFINGGNFSDLDNPGGAAVTYLQIPYGVLGNDISKWHYRIGNVKTDYIAGKGIDSHYIGGRFMTAQRAEVSIWGYNDIVTGAENFYIGKCIFEPYTYYLGVNAHYNYSVIWFIENKEAGDGVNTMDDSSCTIGHHSFVYLQNSSVGETYPAVYNCFDSFVVEEYATYNASMQGCAFKYNRNNATFTAKEGSVVNWLSRGTGTGTFSVGSASTDGYGGTATPNNTVTTFEPGSEVYIYANNNINGAIDLSYLTCTGNKVIIDNPKSFNIRNTGQNFFIQNSIDSLYTGSLEIKTSDIDIWRYTTNIDGVPSDSYMNVGNFKFTSNNTTKGIVTSTNTNLQSTFDVRYYNRISGLNADPEVVWTPVTDADKSFSVKVLLGYFPVGGDTPFNEFGEAVTSPVYADERRVASVKFRLPNGFESASFSSDGSTNYTGYSYNSTTNTFTWTPQSPNNVFQIAGTDIIAIATRNTRSSGETPYTVIDITPPEPAVITTSHVYAGATTSITGTAEAGAKVTITKNGSVLTQNTVVEGDGTFTLELPTDLVVGDVLQIFLEDNAPLASALSDRPGTNSANGNKNPTSNLAYHQATFGLATKLTVEQVYYTPFVIRKVDSVNSDTLLKGAEFRLDATEGTQTPTVTSATTDGSGMLDFGQLLDGTYILTEIDAPDNYKKPLGDWLLEVDHNGGLAGSITFTLRDARGKQENESEYPPEITTSIEEVSTGVNRAVYIVVNEPQTFFAYTTVKASNLTDTISNVGFDLYKREETATEELVTDENIASGDFTVLVKNKRSNSSGYVNFGSLENGVYMLVQSYTPSGYEKPYGQWEITVDSTLPDEDRMQIVAKGPVMPPAFVVDNATSPSTYKLPLMDIIMIPYAGNLGTLMYFGVGITVIELAGITYIFRRKKRIY